jgi:Subtilase family
MSIDSAWREFTTGSPRVTLAYIEGGINWHDPDVKDLAEQMYVNPGELPPPTTPNHDRRLSVADYADTPDYNHNGIVDPEDLIVRFSNHRDDDHNGYVDDISGWDFYDHQNDPATVDAGYDHANNQQAQAAAQADNGFGGAGVCPTCTIVPIKAGAEALDRTDDLAQAWNYAGDIGASVIVSVTADLGYSSFMKQTVDRLWPRAWS